MLNYKLILFDVDGTLANTDELIFQCLEILYDKYRNGVRTPRSKMIYFSGPPMIDTLKVEFPGLDNKALSDEYKMLSNKLCDDTVTLYPNTIECLKELINKGYKLGIVSNKSRINMTKVFDLLGFNGLFDVVICRDDVKNSKPDPEGIEKAIKFMDISKKETIYVGDNYADFLTASNAGVDFVLAKWGARVVKEEKRWEFEADSFDALRRIFCE